MSRFKNMILLLAVLFLPVIDVLMPPAAFCLDAMERKALIASLTKGETFENDGETYIWLPTLTGQKTGAANRAATSGKAGVEASDNSQAIEQKGPFSIYRAPSGTAIVKDRATGQAGDDKPAHPIALNLRTNSLAILTGKLWLKLVSLKDAATIASDYGIIFSFSNAAMVTAFYQAPSGMDLDALRKRLQTDPRIKRVTLDMVDRIRHPR